jgi:hypothetical protein
MISFKRVEWMHQFAENIATAEQAYAPVHVPQASGPSTQQQRPTKKTTTPDQPRDSAYVSPVSQASRIPTQQPSRNTFVTAGQHHGSILAVTGSHAVLPLKQHQPAEKKATTTAHPQSDPLSKAIRRRQQLLTQSGDLNSAYAYDAIPLAILRPVLLTRPTAEQQQLFITRFRAESLTVEATRDVHAAAAVNLRIQGLIDALRAGTSSPQDRIAYHQYISDAKAAILARNFPPLSQDACQVAEDQGPLPPVYQRAATPHGIDGISHLSEIDELMQPAVLSPCPSPPRGQPSPHGQPSPRGQTQPLLSRPNTPLPDNIETEDIIVIQSSPPVSRKRRSDGHQSPPKRVALYSLDTESDTEAEPQLPPRPKRDHRKGASKNPRGPPSAISRKRRAKQVFSQSDKEKLYACPANVYPQTEMPD